MIALQFSSCNDPVSNAIKFFGGFWASHVDIQLSDGTLLGARHDGVQIRPADYEPFEAVEQIRLNAAPAVEARFYDFLRRQIGKPYDFKAVAAKATGRHWRDDDAWFCSELAAAALEQSGWLPRKLAVSVSDVTPRDLLLLVSPWAV